MNANLYENTRKALSSFSNALIRLYGENAPKVFIYGSWARGKAKETSDIDVLLLFSAKVFPGQEIRRVSADLAEINLQYGVLISVLPVYELDYLEGSGPFWQNVKSEVKTIDAI